jgi:maltokinase
VTNSPVPRNASGAPVQPGESAEAVRQVVGASDEISPGVERRVSSDQANLSVAVDERYLVKWFRDPVDRQALATLEQLAALNFEHMPRFIGALEHDGRVFAVVSEFVPDATDGWQWYVADVLSWIDGSHALDHLVHTASRMGSITADLHTALAGDAHEFGSLVALREWVADRRHVAIDQTDGNAGQRLRARLAQIDAALAVLDSPDEVLVQRVHGDLHAGQFLRAGDRLLVTDFDGDPMTSAADRIDLQPVERDVAALQQSIDHVGRVASRRRPGADVSPFIEPAVEAVARAYRNVHVLDDRLLFALRVAQELHEYAYAATRLPVWGYVPDEATTAIFPDEDGAQ